MDLFTLVWEIYLNKKFNKVLVMNSGHELKKKKMLVKLYQWYILFNMIKYYDLYLSNYFKRLIKKILFVFDDKMY